MTIEKPDFLPFTSLPILKEQSLEAGRYIYSLEVTEGPLQVNQVYEILTGSQLDRSVPSDKLRIARQVSQVIGKNMPNFREYSPAKVLHILERA